MNTIQTPVLKYCCNNIVTFNKKKNVNGYYTNRQRKHVCLWLKHFSSVCVRVLKLIVSAPAIIVPHNSVLSLPIFDTIKP